MGSASRSVLGSIIFDTLYNKIEKRRIWKDLEVHEMSLSVSKLCTEVPSCPSTLSYSLSRHTLTSQPPNARLNV